MFLAKNNFFLRPFLCARQPRHTVTLLWRFQHGLSSGFKSGLQSKQPTEWSRKVHRKKRSHTPSTAAEIAVFFTQLYKNTNQDSNIT